MSAVSIDTIAKLLDMTPRRVQQLVKEGILPKPIARGQYEIVPCVVAYIQHLKGSLNGEAGDLLSERARLVRIQADRQALELAKSEGDLISLQEVEQGWSELIVSFRDRLLALPAQIAPTITYQTEREAERILTDHISTALTELSNWEHDDENNPATGIDPDGKPSGAASGTSGKRMG